MAQLTITHLAKGGNEDPIRLNEFYIDLKFGSPVTIDNYPLSDVPRLRSLQALLANQEVSLAVTPTADEVDSGLEQAPQTMGGDDIAPVAAADELGAISTIRKAFAAGGGGSPDDVDIFAAGALPFKFRVLDAVAKISATPGVSTLELRDEAAGAGTVLATMDSGTTGRADASDDASVVATPGASKGLFVRRSDDGVAGEVIATIRRES